MNIHLNPAWQLSESSDTSKALFILNRLFKDYPDSFAVRLWNGNMLYLGDESPAFVLCLQHASVLRDIVLFSDPVRLAETYFSGEIQIEGDFNAAVHLRYYFEALSLPLHEKLGLVFRALSLSDDSTEDDSTETAPFPASPKETGSAHPQQNGFESIAFHYDVSNDFYRLWLDERMLYSCAYFETPEQDLDQAQRNKLDLICRKLRLQPGESLLDIGCGWGALACWAASHYGVSVHGITLSQEQFDYAQQQVKKQGLEQRVKIELLNYRDLADLPTYDKVSSIGMFEHVGLQNLRAYFAKVHTVLKPGGLFLNHGITSEEPGWQRGISTEFINRYVFPDGELDTISNIQERMETARFEVFDVEGLRPHYAMTLRHWVSRLEENHESIVSLVSERTYRIWRLYMTGSAIQFEQGATGIYQILAVRRQSGFPPLPLTRRDLYEN